MSTIDHEGVGKVQLLLFGQHECVLTTGEAIYLIERLLLAMNHTRELNDEC